MALLNVLLTLEHMANIEAALRDQAVAVAEVTFTIVIGACYFVHHWMAELAVTVINITCMHSNAILEYMYICTLSPVM